MSEVDRQPEWMSPPRAWYAAIILLVTYTLAYIDRTVIGLLIEPIRTDFGISDTQVSLLGGAAFAIFYVVMGVPLGRLADRVNRRNLIIAGLVVWSGMTAACGLAAGFWHLFVARVWVGVGEAALTPAALSIISDSFPPRKRPLPLGLYMCGITFGGGLAYVVGGLVISWAAASPDLVLPMVGEVRPWQLVFFVVGLPGLALALLLCTLREPARHEIRRRRVDGAPETMPVREVLHFVFTENRGTFLVIFIAYGLLALHSLSLPLWLPAHFRRNFGWTEGDFGVPFGLLVLIFGTVGMLGGSALAVRLQRGGRQDALLRTALIMTLLMIAPAIAAPLMPGPRSTLLTVTPVIALSYGLFALIPGLIHGITPNEMRGQAGALFSVFNSVIGYAVGGTFVALLTDYLFGDPKAVGYSLSLTAAMILPLCAVLLCLGLRPFRMSVERAGLWTG